MTKHDDFVGALRTVPIAVLWLLVAVIFIVWFYILPFSSITSNIVTEVGLAIMALISVVAFSILVQIGLLSRKLDRILALLEKKT